MRKMIFKSNVELIFMQKFSQGDDIVELTSEEQAIINQTYGRQFNDKIGYGAVQVEKIVELSAEEKIFFANKNFISPYFAVQTLYKLKGELTPIRFNRVVHDMIKEEENFRANFCELNDRVVKIIFSERRTHPDVVYRTLMQTDDDEVDETLTKIMEADRRVSFDLKHGHLIRFSIFRTAETEFAVLITMPQIIASSFNQKNFFAAVQEIQLYKKEKKLILKSQPEQIETAIRDYWGRVLKDLPSMPTLPYTKPSNAPYNPQSFREKIPADILSDLREKAQSNRLMLMSILQSAWGFFLQAVRSINDVIFCQFSPNMKGENFFLNVIPVRQKSAGTMTVEQIINQQFRQLVVSQPYGFSDWELLQTLTGGKTFDHFLSFVDFKGTDTKTYSEIPANEQGVIVTSHSWDPQGMKLGVYFQYTSNTLSMTFLYDAHRFFKNVGERFAKIYNVVLRLMLVHWHAPFANFIKKLVQQMKVEMDSERDIVGVDDKKVITDFIIKNPLLQGRGAGLASFFTNSARLITKFEGDRIFGDILNENLIFVVEGKLARSLDTGDGWFKALDIISKGGWLNENVFLEKKRTEISAEILTEQAKLLIIPLDKAESLFLAHSDVAKNFFEHILKQVEKYQLLWIES